MKRTVVFGGSGFLGSYVADQLTEAGHKVLVVDLKPSPYLHAGQEMLIADLRSQKDVANAVRGARYVYNFAGVADLHEAHEHPIETIRSNILGNCHLLEECSKAKVQRYVFASTIYVYSRAGSFYNASKQACEAYIENYRRYRGLEYTILRYGSLYGGRATGSNIVRHFIQEALGKRRMTYFGDGEETREYIHVEDAARYSVEILAPEYANQNIIITGHQSIRVRELMEMIAEILGGRIRLEFNSKRVSAPGNTHYHRTPYSYIPKLGRKLIGRQYIDLGQGLLRMIDEIHTAVHHPKR